MEKRIFKKGDRVFHFINKMGNISAIILDRKYPIIVTFDNGHLGSFTLNGEEYRGEDATLSFTEYNLINGGFSQNREDRIIFTNTKGDVFNEKYLMNNEIYFVNKITYKIMSLEYDLPIFKILELKETKETSEIFKTQEEAEVWLEEYKKSQLKLEDVYYLAETKAEKVELLTLLKEEVIGEYFSLGSLYSIIAINKVGKINSYSKLRFNGNKTKVDKDTFLDLLDVNNLLK